MIKPDPIFVSKMISDSIDKIAESNIDSQNFNNSLNIPKGERDNKLLGPALAIIAFGAFVGLSVYLINQYEEENKMKTV